VRLHSITRHMHGLMAGREGPGRGAGSVGGRRRPEAGPETLYSALPILNQGLALKRLKRGVPG